MRKIFDNPKLVKIIKYTGCTLVCLIPVVFLVTFLSKIDLTDKTDKNNVSSSEINWDGYFDKTIGSSMGATQEHSTETGTEKGENSYQVVEGQEAVNKAPNKNYAGVTETDKFFADSVFVGDSITVGWSSYVNNKGSGFFNNPIMLAKVGYSISAALSSDYIHPGYNGTRDYIYNSIAKMNVDKVFISFGLNDSINAPKNVVANYEKLIGLIQKNSPNARIYVISTTYVCKGKENGAVTSANVRKYNQLVRDMCVRKGYTYIDVASYLSTTEGYLPRIYSADGYVHLNAKAYSIWEIVLRNVAMVEMDEANGEKTNADDLVTLPDKVVEEELPTETETQTVNETERSSESQTEPQSGTQAETESTTNAETESQTEKVTEKETEISSSKEPQSQQSTESATQKATETEEPTLPARE